jgi:cytidine deaminase
MNKEQRMELIKAAKTVSKFAYAPYSKFKVGAALLSKSGNIFTGCNVENASYGLTVCAERVAVFKAITEGEINFAAIAIYTNTKDFTLPCGACLQVLKEFAKDLTIITVNRYGKSRTYQLAQLLPHPFN